MTIDERKVRHSAPNIFDKSTLIEDAVTFYLDNKLYTGWKTVSVTRTLNSVSGSYKLTILDRFTEDGDAWELKPGKRAHLHLGRNAVFEGYIDNMDASYSSSTRNVTLTGRDRTADLVDCSVVGELEYQNLTIQQVAEKLLVPFGIKVLALSSVGEPFPTISIRPAEKVFDVLQRLARQRGLLLYSSTHGNLIIGSKGVTRASTELVQGVNILEASVTFDNTDRYSDYIVKAQNDGLTGSKSEDGTEAEGSAKDAGVGRYRPSVIIAETSGDTSMAKTRAQWEATYKSSKAMTIKIKVAGWREKNGDLWDINRLVYLNSPSVGVSDQFLINAVNYTQSENQARVCTLELVRKDSYDVKPEVPMDDDPLAGLGL